ncbi:hypothetical protein ACFL5K_05795 [Gemmatimonadota bacterium]
MCSQINFTGSMDKEKNIEAIRLIEKLGVSIDYIETSPLLDEIVTTPFISTNEGESYFGLQAITEFVSNHLSIK